MSPRFAPTSTQEQLNAASQLLREYPSIHLHTHLSENKEEINWVNSLFPDCKSYLNVYEHAGLLRRRSTLAHCLHLTETDWKILRDKECSVAFCPSSNLFLGSGLFDLPRAQAVDVNVGIGTDVGAGTSLSILQTISDAYKTQRLAGSDLSPFSALYMATLGGAKSLDCEADIGNFKIGKEADFIVLDPESTPIMRYRTQHCESLQEMLFGIALLGTTEQSQQHTLMVNAFTAETVMKSLMDTYFLNWLELIFRWLHVITGIAWIGVFYFIWLDNSLEDPQWKRDNGVKGELWAVHGGGIYEVAKYRLGPAKMPETLHWFKWEAYSTWLTGMALLVLIFYVGATVI